MIGYPLRIVNLAVIFWLICTDNSANLQVVNILLFVIQKIINCGKIHYTGRTFSMLLYLNVNYPSYQNLLCKVFNSSLWILRTYIKIQTNSYINNKYSTRYVQKQHLYFFHGKLNYNIISNNLISNVRKCY